MKKYLAIVFVLSLASCVDDEGPKVSDRSIRGRWHLVSFRLSQPVDLNGDGFASIDMTQEFDCVWDENILISDNGNNFTLNHSGLITADGVYCSEGEPERNFGDIEKVDSHTIRLHFTNNDPAYAKEFNLTGGRLSKIETMSFPSAYDNAMQTWTYSTMQIRKEYSRNVDISL
jgi:hypothetical protein